MFWGDFISDISLGHGYDEAGHHERSVKNMLGQKLGVGARAMVNCKSQPIDMRGSSHMGKAVRIAIAYDQERYRIWDWSGLSDAL